MLTFVFIFFIAMFAIGGIIIATKAKRRPDGKAERPNSNITDTAKIGRASGGDD